MKNFGPYIEPMVLTFTKDTLTLITGKNGIGKTMSLDSIPFTFFGMTSKKAKGDDVVNNVVGKNCKTWVKFATNGDQYKVTRYQKYTKYGNTVILNRNGKDIKKGHKEVVPEIEKLICPQKSFMNTLMFGQKIKDFFTDLVDSDKKEIFRLILGLEKYIVYYSKVSEEVKIFKDAKLDIETEIKVQKGILANVISDIERYNSDVKNFNIQKESDLEELDRSVTNTQRLLNKWNADLESEESKKFRTMEDILSELNKTQNEIDSIDKDINTKLKELDAQRSAKVSELNDEANTRKNQITNTTIEKTDEIQIQKDNITEQINNCKTKYQNKDHEIVLQINHLHSQVEKFSERVDEIKFNVLESDIAECPTCEQSVDESIKETLSNKCNTYNAEIEKYNQEKEELQIRKNNFSITYKEELDALNKTLSVIKEELTNTINESEQRKQEIDTKLSELVRQVESVVYDKKGEIEQEGEILKADLEQRKSQIITEKDNKETSNDFINTVKQTIQSLEGDLKALENQIKNKNEDEYDRNGTQLARYQNIKGSCEKTILDNQEQLGIIDKKLAVYEFWKTAFSSTGIPSMLIDDSIPFMNKKIAEYLDFLTNGRYIVSFDTQDTTKAGEFRDKIAVHVLDIETKANSRVQLSGGQTRIVDIATILTLGDLQSNIQNVKFNFLIFDEIFDALDYENATYVSKVLNKFKLGKSIYVISHQIQDQLEADEHLQFGA